MLSNAESLTPLAWTKTCRPFSINTHANTHTDLVEACVISYPHVLILETKKESKRASKDRNNSSLLPLGSYFVVYEKLVLQSAS